MPLYEYECQGCGARFEYLVRGDDQASCPQCGGRTLTKLISATAHVSATSSSSPCSCPARDSGACGSPCCPHGGCGL